MDIEWKMDEGWYGWDYGSNGLRGIYWEEGLSESREIQHRFANGLYLDAKF